MVEIVFKQVFDVKKILEVEHYIGSLDFPCDCCNHNSYDNFHFKKDDKTIFVFCKKCIKEMIR